MTRNRQLVLGLSFLLGCGPTAGELDNGFSNEGGNGSARGGVGGQRNGQSGGDGFFSVPDKPDSGSQPPETCASIKNEAKTAPVGIFMLLDQSGSMTEAADLWTPVSQALLSFIQSPELAGVEVGLQYFPLGASKVEDPAICKADVYQTPNVVFAALPASAATLRGSIEAHKFTKAQAKNPAHWGTPTGPAVDGVIAYVKAWKVSHPQHRVAIVLATDGKPSSLCKYNSLDEIAARLDAAVKSPAQIQTFVIGIGKIESLDKLALGGGTGQKAFVVDALGGAKTQADFVAALSSIRNLSLPCDYTIPASTMGDLDLDQVNVDVQKGATPLPFVRVDSATACGEKANAWHYDNAASPTKLQLCPKSCDVVRTMATKVEIAVGCRSRVVL